jgi:hypothetical protein
MMVNDDSRPERLVNYDRNPTYERRVVIFYDVLGWRSQITRAGNDSERIGDFTALNPSTCAHYAVAYELENLG